VRLVKAKELGFHNGSRVRPGTTFPVPDTFRGKWVEDVTPPPAPEPAPMPEPPPRRSYTRRAVDEKSPPVIDGLS
jgi:hypothetical protein